MGLLDGCMTGILGGPGAHVRLQQHTACPVLPVLAIVGQPADHHLVEAVGVLRDTCSLDARDTCSILQE